MILVDVEIHLFSYFASKTKEFYKRGIYKLVTDGIKF